MSFNGFKEVVLALALLAASHSAALAKCQVQILANLPVTLVGLRPLVPVKINGHEFMLTADSGAFFSTLSVSAASELQLQRSMMPQGFILKGAAGSADAWSTEVKDFELAGIPLQRVDFLVAGISGNVGAGLLGCSPSAPLRQFRASA